MKEETPIVNEPVDRGLAEKHSDGSIVLTPLGRHALNHYQEIIRFCKSHKRMTVLSSLLSLIAVVISLIALLLK